MYPLESYTKGLLIDLKGDKKNAVIFKYVFGSSDVFEYLLVTSWLKTTLSGD